MTYRIEPPPIVLIMEENEKRAKAAPDATVQHGGGGAAALLEQEEQEHAAATKVQSTQRGRSERRRFGKRRDTQRKEQHAAATTVQSRQRMRLERERFKQRRDAERKRQKCLPPFVNVYVEAADGNGSVAHPRGRKVDASALSQFSGCYDRVDEVDVQKVKGAKVSHYVHRNISAHLYQSTAGLWVLSTVFAPGCTVANAFCHHPKPERPSHAEEDTEETSPEKPRKTRSEALAVAGAPLGPHQWHFYSPPKRAELSPDGSFSPTMRSVRGGWLTVVVNITVRDPFGRTASGQPEGRERRRLTQAQVHPLRPQLVEIYLKYNTRKLQTVDRQLNEYAGREAELLADLEQEYGPLDSELQQTFSKVAEEENVLRAPGVSQQQPRRLDPLPASEMSSEPLVLAPAPAPAAVDRTTAPLPAVHEYALLVLESVRVSAKHSVDVSAATLPDLIGAVEQALGLRQRTDCCLEIVHSDGRVERMVELRQLPEWETTRVRATVQLVPRLPPIQNEPEKDAERKFYGSSNGDSAQIAESSEKQQALRHQDARRAAAESASTALRPSCPTDQYWSASVTPVVAATEGGYAAMGGSLEASGGGGDGSSEIVGSSTFGRLREHTDGADGTAAAGAPAVGVDGGTVRARYKRPDLELCAPLPLPQASEATALALFGAGATCIAMPQPPRSYRVMAAGMFDTVVPALRVTLGQSAEGAAQDQEPRRSCIAELEGALVAGGVPEFRGLSRADVDAVRGWLGVAGEATNGVGPWGSALGLVIPAIAAAGYSFARGPESTGGGMGEAAKSLRRLIVSVLGEGSGRDHASGRRPRVIAQVDSRAGEEAALAALAEAQDGPVDEVIVLTGAECWTDGSGGDTAKVAAKIVQRAAAAGLRTLVEVCVADTEPGASGARAAMWGADGGATEDEEAIGGRLAEDVVERVERGTDSAAEIGSGGVWLSGRGAGSTVVVAAAARALARHT